MYRTKLAGDIPSPPNKSNFCASPAEIGPPAAQPAADRPLFA